MPTRRIAGIKTSIPAGYVLGRTQGGEGDVGLIAIRDLGGSLIASGAVAAPGASGTTNFIGRQIKTATGTYTKSAGTTLVRIILLGGGAAGGGAPATGATQQSEGAGGGAGGLTDVVASVTAYDGHTVTIGAGGTGGTGLGGSGGNSTFAGLTANGGTGGGAGVLTNIGVAGGVGGTASGGDINLTGRKGWFSSIALNGGDTLSGAGAEAPYGLGTPGAMVQTATTAAGLSATGFGAGGSGAANGASQSAATGGNGSPGLCIIDEYGPASGGGGGGFGAGTVTSLSQGTGITLTPNPITSTGTIDNAGVTSNVAGTGISVSGATGAVTIGNTGVTSLTGGNNVKVSGSTGAVTLSSNSINPTGADADLVPWAAIEGLRWKYTCTCGTTAALPTVTYSNGSSGSGATLTASATGVVVVDGHTLALSDSVLVKNQVSGFQNGIYQVTTAGAVGVALVLTRAPWNDDVVGTTGYTAAMSAGEMLAVLFGTSNGNSIWQNTSTGSGGGGAVVVGTDSIAYTKISQASSVSGGFSGHSTVTEVQRISAAVTAGGTLTCTLGASPTAGNLLIAMGGGWKAGIRPPIGFVPIPGTLIASSTGFQESVAASSNSQANPYGSNFAQQYDNESVQAWVYIVQGGDGTGWSFNVSSDHFAIVLAEYSGVGSVKMQSHIYGPLGAVTTVTAYAPLVQPEVNGEQIWIWMEQDGHSTISVSTGYTIAHDLNTAGHETTFAKRNSLINPGTLETPQFSLSSISTVSNSFPIATLRLVPYQM